MTSQETFDSTVKAIDKKAILKFIYYSDFQIYSSLLNLNKQVGIDSDVHRLVLKPSFIGLKLNRIRYVIIQMITLSSTNILAVLGALQQIYLVKRFIKSKNLKIMIHNFN